MDLENRYKRQELIIGQASQSRLKNAQIVIVGVGALGSVSAELLTRAGIANITLIDRDVVELSNLQRQSLYSEADIGSSKAIAAAARLNKINSNVNIKPIVTDLNHRNIEIISNYDLILDCCDNIYTRLLINDYCHRHKQAWIHAAAVKDYGSLMLVKAGSCFRCFCAEENLDLDTCQTVGIFGMTTNIIASIQAKLALDYLINPLTAETKLIQFNLDNYEITKIRLTPRMACPCCSADYEYLRGDKEMPIIRDRCLGAFQFVRSDLDLERIRDKLSKIEKIRGDTDHLFFRNMSVFASGKITIKANSLEQAKSDLSKYLGV